MELYHEFELSIKPSTELNVHRLSEISSQLGMIQLEEYLPIF